MARCSCFVASLIAATAGADCEIECHNGPTLWQEALAERPGLKLVPGEGSQRSLCFARSPDGLQEAAFAFSLDPVKAHTLQVQWKSGAEPWRLVSNSETALADGLAIPDPSIDLNCTAWREDRLFLSDSLAAGGPRTLLRFGPKGYEGHLSEIAGAALDAVAFQRGWTYSLSGDALDASDGTPEDSLTYAVTQILKIKHRLRFAIHDLATMRTRVLREGEIANPISPDKRKACLAAIDKMTRCTREKGLQPKLARKLDPLNHAEEIRTMIRSGYDRQAAAQAACPVALLETSCRYVLRASIKVRIDDGARRIALITQGGRERSWSVADELRLAR